MNRAILEAIVLVVGTIIVLPLLGAGVIIWFHFAFKLMGLA